MSKPTTAGPAFTVSASMPGSAAFLRSCLHGALTRTVGITADVSEWPSYLVALDKAHVHFAAWRPPAQPPSWLLEASKPNSTALKSWASDLELKGEGTPELIAKLREAAAEMKVFLQDQPPEPMARPLDSLKQATARLAAGSCVCRPTETCPDHMLIIEARDAKLRDRARLIEAANRREREAERKIEDPHLVAKRERREQEQAARRAEFASKPAVTVYAVPGIGSVDIFFDQPEVWQVQQAMAQTGDLVQFAFRWRTETGGASYVSDLHLAEVNRLLAALRSVGAVKDGGDVGKQEFSPAWVNRGGEFFHESGKADASGGAAFVTISEAR